MKCLILVGFVDVSRVVKGVYFDDFTGKILCFLSEFEESLVFQGFEGCWRGVFVIFGCGESGKNGGFMGFARSRYRTRKVEK